ncbi:6-carboxy-5,6,7,8-tetrahydropterin synthase [hydrothermal vent metagenome]|uniref:6-carboxy-5,6,7,8-tetrahydropterin synthase n=1 Tax=hydrothermal vent metagenome TaxID=652676 RepID=A0A3B1ATS3_9ZZZZ
MTRLFVDNLTVIDFSYLHPDRGLLGESWLLDVELEGALDYQGMVLDFGEIKQQVKHAVDDGFDHKLIIPTRYMGASVEKNNQLCEVRFRCESGEEIYHSGPISASCLIDADEISPGNLARAIEAKLKPILPNNVFQVTIRLRSENCEGVYYHVSHGLKHHAGNCQRIAHGHRSCFEIYKDGIRSAQIEADWAERWNDIYIGTRDDLIELREINGRSYCQFGYRSPQGQFELLLPQDRCYLIDTDSTVENLAQHIADSLKDQQPTSNFHVRLFEGIAKGAIAEA